MQRGMGGGSGGGQGGGGGRGMGKGGGRGRMGGTGQSVGGSCVCPQCGKMIPHQQGQPCNQMKCPECGTTMTRQI